VNRFLTLAAATAIIGCGRVSDYESERPPLAGEKRSSDVDETLAEYDHAAEKSRALSAIPESRMTPWRRGSALEAERDRRCLDIYVGLLASEDFGLRWRALEQLRKLTGNDFDYFASATTGQRAPSTLRWKRWLESDGSTHKLRW